MSSYKRLLIFLLIILALGFFSIFYPQLQEFTGQTIESLDNYEKEPAILTRVIDGDTIKVIMQGESEEESIRMLGINTPEKKMPYANASRDFLKQFENKTIYLLRDKEDIDKYNRKLRYVFYESRFLNLEILESGFANAYYFEGLKYEKNLLGAEVQARKLEIGIWTSSQDICADCIVLVDLQATNETFILKNSCDFDCELEGWFVKDAGRNTFYLKPIQAKQEQTTSSEKDVWNNYGDQFFLFDKVGKLVLYFDYNSN
jgi:endonuclease YncB( thermonuclease family)